MRQPNNQSHISSQQQSLEAALDSLEFPLFRQKTASDDWRRDVTVTRIAKDGSSVSIRHQRGISYDQESVSITIGHEPLDTGNMDYTCGRGEYASSEPQFAGLLALHAQLLAKASEQVGPIPEAAADQLLQSVSLLKNNNGQRLHESPRAPRQQ